MILFIYIYIYIYLFTYIYIHIYIKCKYVIHQPVELYPSISMSSWQLAINILLNALRRWAFVASRGCHFAVVICCYCFPLRKTQQDLWVPGSLRVTQERVFAHLTSGCQVAYVVRSITRDC